MRDRKGDQRGGEWEPIQNSCKLKIWLSPKCTPNPRVLGTAWSSYGGATPTQESPRNKQEQPRKQTRENT